MSGLRRIRISNLEVPSARGPLVAGVVNVSPESPEKSSVVPGPKQAYERAARLRDAGASLIDVGGRSSNPAAADVTDAVESRRVLPVVERLSAAGFAVSVDTWSPAVARAAGSAGAHLINDAEGLQHPHMLDAVAESGLPVVIPFLDAPSPRDLGTVDLDDPLGQIVAGLRAALSRAAAAGIHDVLLDPGTGFARPRLGDAGHDRWQRAVHADLHPIRALGAPVLAALPLRATRAATVEQARLLLLGGADIVRAHDPSVVTEALRSVGSSARADTEEPVRGRAGRRDR